MSRETENVVLLLVGITGIMVVATGIYTRYVKPSLMPWLLAGAVLIVVLALAAIIRDVRHGGRHLHEDGHAHRNTVVWLLVIPVVVLTFIKPPPIGANAADTTVTAVSTDVLRRPFPPLPSDRAPAVALPEVLLRVAQDTAGTLDDRAITVTGFTLRSGEQVDLARVVIVCCAADAQLARIHLGGTAAAEAARFPEETWLEVEGVVPPGQNDSTRRTVPTIMINSVRRIESPPNPYAY